VEELGYWPTKTDFIREACLEKLEKHRQEMRLEGTLTSEEVEVLNILRKQGYRQGAIKKI